MKQSVKLTIAALFALSLGVFGMYATSQTVNDAGYMDPSFHNHWQSDTFITTTGTTSMSSSGAIGTGTSAGGGMNLEDSNGMVLYYYTLSSTYPYNSGSTSASGLPAATYHVVHGVNGVNYETWNFSTTLTW